LRLDRRGLRRPGGGWDHTQGQRTLNAVGE
jgi:hypothetical protein